MDKESRSLKKRWKERQLAAARRRFPLPEEHLDELFAGVAAALESAECDDTLKHTRAWLAANYLPAEPIVEWLEDHGGYCDCEVLMNSAVHFEELRTRE
ncbi:MAG TPA: DUF2695 domain-containing protein [Polyangiaceae bacterium]